MINEYKILDLLLEEYDLDDESMLINQILLGEESPINIIDKKLNDNEIDKSDEASKEVTDLLNLDNIDFNNNNKSNDDNESSSLIEKDNDNKLLKVDVYPDDDFDEDDEKSEELNIKLKNIDDNISDLLKVDIMKDDNIEDNDNIDKEIEVKIDSAQNFKNDENSSDTTLKVNINDNTKTKGTLKVNIDDDAKTEGTISLKLKNNNNDSKDLKLKVVDTSTANATGAPGEIRLKLKNFDNELDDKTSEFIKKRDELLQNGNPNFQLSTCLKIIVDLKESLDRLINHIPNEIILVKTKYLIADMLDQIMDNSTLILKDKDRLREIIYKVFSMIISINDYITNKYNELEDKLDNNDKKEKEDIQIKSSINKAENKTIEDKNNENNENNEIEKNTKKIPNINKKKI